MNVYNPGNYRNQSWTAEIKASENLDIRERPK
jgi:hypothetical protein